MNLTEQINNDLKEAMKAKEKVKLESLRAVKSALLLAATEKGAGESSEDAEMKILQRLVKQRKEAADIFMKESREELATAELEQAKFIEVYLPEQMSGDAIKAEVEAIIASTGASSMADMGKVMGMANKKMAGKADGKVIAQMVKSTLSS